MHTPGPWTTNEYVENKRTNRKVSYIWGQQVSTIATVENGPREANAKLIAAAPDMLDCLCLIEGTYVYLDTTTAGQEPQHTNVVNALRKIREVIARAKGE